MYSEGLARLTRALIEAINVTGTVAQRGDVTYLPQWQSGRAIPRSIQFEIAPAGARVVHAAFSRAQVEDCWEKIDRPDVLGAIQRVAGEYVYRKSPASS